LGDESPLVQNLEGFSPKPAGRRKKVIKGKPKQIKERNKSPCKRKEKKIKIEKQSKAKKTKGSVKKANQKFPEIDEEVRKRGRGGK